jgi:hypothetical protein
MAANRYLRALAPVLLAVGAILVAVGPVAAVDPPNLLDEDAGRRTWPPLNEPLRVAPPGPSRTPSPTPTVRPTPSPEPSPAYGIDVSYPQCGDELPEEFAFAIVGVNGGRVYSPNACLIGTEDDPGQLAWAGRAVELYANTGNPGPRLSRFWPGVAVDDDGCRADGLFATADTLECAYRYGWNAAADSYRLALHAFVATDWAEEDAEALPWATTWWLDVETANSWRLDRRLNVATLEGARDYLLSMGVAEVGFYSTPRMWARITGDTDAFADAPAWHAGARHIDDARDRCEGEDAFTGGELRMVQWVEDGLDHNLRCPDA